MSKIQVYAKNSSNETVLLQLASYEPIKINLSISEIDQFTPIAYWTQNFMVPGQGTNVQFFEDVYSVNGTSFDPTVSAEAWVLADGFLFASGNLILTNVFINEKFGTIEYEVLFTGDVSNFATEVGDGYMNEIDTVDLNHDLTLEVITSSWNASAGTTNGFKDGNVLYPLIEWGYDYGASGANQNIPIQSTLSHGFQKSFTSITEGLELRQFKPATRIKWLWDKIFADAGYTYESEFINSEFFDKMYFVSDSAARALQDLESGLCKVTADTFLGQWNRSMVVPLVNILTNPDGSFKTTPNKFIGSGLPTTNVRWVAPVNGTYTFTFQTTASYDSVVSAQSAAFRVDFVLNGINTISSELITIDYPTDTIDYTKTLNYGFTSGDELQIKIFIPSYSNRKVEFSNTFFEVSDGPDQVIVSSFYPGEGQMKKIDFVKGIVQMFNLVLEPSINSIKHFIIEPWTDWVGTGETKDWTPYLDGSKEMKFTPLFQDFNRNIVLTGTDDSDLQNTIYQDQFKQNYWFRQYNSGINIIRDTQQFTSPFAPTPVESIPFKSGTVNFPGEWLFPTLAKLQPGDPNQLNSGQMEPILPKPRIVFYNGKVNNPIPWYLYTSLLPPFSGSAQTQYPLVSQWENYPPDQNTFELTFQSKKQLIPDEYYDFLGPTSNDLFSTYWRTYLEWIYNAYSKKLTAYFRLSPYDIQTLKYNDKVWVKDCWYLIQKIYDYPIGDTEVVKVDLLKIPDSVTPFYFAPATGGTAGTQCESISICYTATLLDPDASYTYVDCLGNNQTITLSPNTCASLCMLWPLINPLPSGFTAIPNGNCPGGIYATAGANMLMNLSATGSAFGNITRATLSGATGGTSGTFIPLQYYSFDGQNNLSLTFNVPFDYGVRWTLEWANGASGQPYTASVIDLLKNSVVVATANRVLTYQPISATYPAGITAGSYTANLTINY